MGSEDWTGLDKVIFGRRWLIKIRHFVLHFYGEMCNSHNRLFVLLDYRVAGVAVAKKAGHIPSDSL